MTLERDHHQRAADKAAGLGLSLAEYIRRLVAADLDLRPAADGDISEIFGIGDSGGSNVARHKAQYIAEAIAAAKIGTR